MEQNYSSESFYVTDRRIYTSLADGYTRALKALPSPALAPDTFLLRRSTAISGSFMPNRDFQRVTDFSHRFTSSVPTALYRHPDLEPTSTIHLKALTAAVYNHNSVLQPRMLDQEMYLRALTALSGNLNFSNNSFKSEEALEGVFERGFDPAMFYDFWIHLVGSTMPVTGYDDLEEQDAAYQSYLKRLQAEVGQYKTQTRDQITLLIPGRAIPATLDESYPIVIVNKMVRQPVLSTIEEGRQRSTYNQYVPAGITWGVDPVTGLPLVLHTKPYNFDHTLDHPDETKRSRDKGSDPAYIQAHDLIHEGVHTVNFSVEKHSNSWILLMNELLTDSATNKSIYKAHGYTLTDAPREIEPSTGYKYLVRFATSLVKQGVLTEDNLAQFGFEQDPFGFIEVLNQKVPTLTAEQQRTLIRSLAINRLIPPVKVSEVPDKAKQFAQNPSQFLQQEMMTAWGQLDSSYLGDPFWLSFSLDDFREDNDYYQKMKDAHLKHRPDDEFHDIFIMYDPETWLFTDEVVDYFRRVYTKNAEGQKYFGFVPLEKIDSDRLADFQIADETIDTSLHLNNATHQQTIKDLFRASNKLLSIHAYMDEDVDRMEIALDFIKNAYVGIAQVLSRNWIANGVEANPEDIVKIIKDIAPEWFKTHKVESNDFDGLLERLMKNTDILTRSYMTEDNGQKIPPSKDMLLYFGPALIDKTES